MLSDPGVHSTPEKAGMTNDEEAPFSNIISDKTNVVEINKAEPEAIQSELARKLREKEEMLASVVEKRKKGLLQLLDLPVDVLRDIVKEVRSIFEAFISSSTLTNDSTGHAHKRSYISRIDAFCAPKSCHTSYLLAVRYRLAGRTFDSGATEWCRRPDVWPGNSCDAGRPFR